jgi:deoxycytidine triphosphate deaminase
MSHPVGASRSHPSGMPPSTRAVLGSSEISGLLEQGWLLRADTFDETCLRESGYDLRVADDFFLAPSGSLFDYGDRQRDGVLSLEPGEMAMVSTRERLCLPPNITAHIGIKFSYLTRGLLVLTGSFVDPGYALSESEWDAWQDWQATDESGTLPSADDEDGSQAGRLHFYLVNFSPVTVHVKMGEDTLATLQFLFVAGTVSRPRTTRGQDQAVRDQFGLTTPSAEQAQRLRFALIQSVERRLAEQGEALRESRQRQDQLSVEIDRVSLGISPILQFGVILVAATLLGVVFNALISLDNKDYLERLSRVFIAVGGKGLYLAITILGLGLIANAVALLATRSKHPNLRPARTSSRTVPHSGNEVPR